jgi:hypothetical protein
VADLTGVWLEGNSRLAEPAALVATCVLTFEDLGLETRPVEATAGTVLPALGRKMDASVLGTCLLG